MANQQSGFGTWWNQNSGNLKGLGGDIQMTISGGTTVGLAMAARNNAKVQARAYKWQGQVSAAALRRQGDNAIRNAGLAQKQGMDAASLRLEALGREISGQRVAAAGSGIDLSSKTVAKAEETSRTNATSDVSRISDNTKIVTDNYTLQAQEAYRDSAYAKIAGEYQAKVAKSQGEYERKMGLLSGLATAIVGDGSIFGRVVSMSV